MNAVDTKINYFLSRMDEVKRAEVHFKSLFKNYTDEFGVWLRDQGLPETFTPVELIAHFRRKSELIS